MITLEQLSFWLPAEAQGSLLTLAQHAICNGCPAGVGAGDPAAAPPPYDIYLAIYASDAPIVAGSVFNDFGFNPPGSGDHSPIKLNGEAAPDYCLDMIEGPAPGMDGLWRLVVDQQIFGPTGSGGEFYGAGLVLVPEGDTFGDPGTMLLGVARFSAPPVVMDGVADLLKITAELVPCLCLPPDIPVVPEP